MLKKQYLIGLVLIFILSVSSCSVYKGSHIKSIQPTKKFSEENGYIGGEFSSILNKAVSKVYIGNIGTGNIYMINLVQIKNHLDKPVIFQVPAGRYRFIKSEFRQLVDESSSTSGNVTTVTKTYEFNTAYFFEEYIESIINTFEVTTGKVTYIGNYLYKGQNTAPSDNPKIIDRFDNFSETISSQMGIASEKIVSAISQKKEDVMEGPKMNDEETKQ